MSGHVQTFPAFGFRQQQPSIFGQQQQPSFFGQQQQPSIFGQQQQPSIFGQQQQPSIFGQQQQPSIFGQQQQPSIFGQQQQPSIFGQQMKALQSNTFGQKQQPQSSIFGQQQKTSLFGQQQPSVFGQQQPSVFGQQQASVFGQQQPSVFGQQQPSVFGQQQPTVFGQQQPTVFGQQQPSVFGQQQPSVFGQQQPSVFGQQQTNIFGQQQPLASNFGPFGQPSNFPQQFEPSWFASLNFGQQPQPIQQMFVPSNQNFHQIPPQFFQDATSQVVWMQTVDQNGQMSFVPVAYNTFNGFSPTVAVNQNQNRNTIGMLPAATLNTAINGRGPSLFSTDPAFDSPLYTWKRDPSNWRRYPNGLNSSLASTFIDPPGLWTLPSATSYLPKRSAVASDQHNSSNYRNATNSLFEERDMTFQQWNNALKRTSSAEDTRKRQYLRNAESYQRFKLAYDNDDGPQAYPEGSFCAPLKRDDNDPKRLNPQLVRDLEGLRGPRMRSCLNHPYYKLGQRYASNHAENSKSCGPKIELVRNPDNRDSEGVGLFNQPTPGKIPCFLKTFPVGPPKDNSFDYCSHDPWLTRQKIYDQLTKEFTAEKFTTRLPKAVYHNRNQETPEQTPRSRPRYWTEPMENPPNVCRPPHEPLSGGYNNQTCQTTSTVILNRPGYYCIPDKATLDCCVNSKGQCFVEDFEVGHESFGKVKFPGVTDVAGLNLDKIIQFSHKSFVIYPEGLPPYGQGLHREGIVTLFNVYPTLRDNEEVIRDPKIIEELRFDHLLRKASDRFGGQFLGYDSTKGLWVFKIQCPRKT